MRQENMSIVHQHICNQSTMINDHNIFDLASSQGYSVILTHLRDNGRFSERTTCFYVAQIIQASEYLHSVVVIHRNIRPENLVVDSMEYLKITGFEFAKCFKGQRERCAGPSMRWILECLLLLATLL